MIYLRFCLGIGLKHRFGGVEGMAKKLGQEGDLGIDHQAEHRLIR
jgi:hypothetical protein